MGRYSEEEREAALEIIGTIEGEEDNETEQEGQNP